jgi:hypothetical protein
MAIFRRDQLGFEAQKRPVESLMGWARSNGGAVVAFYKSKVYLRKKKKVLIVRHGAQKFRPNEASASASASATANHIHPGNE